MSTAREVPTKRLMVTQQECELILDAFKVSNPQTRPLALKAASLTLEFAGLDAVDESTRVLTIHRAVVAETEAKNGPGRGSDAAVDGGAAPPPAGAA